MTRTGRDSVFAQKTLRHATRVREGVRDTTNHSPSPKTSWPCASNSVRLRPASRAPGGRVDVVWASAGVLARRASRIILLPFRRSAQNVSTSLLPVPLFTRSLGLVFRSWGKKPPSSGPCGGSPAQLEEALRLAAPRYAGRSVADAKVYGVWLVLGNGYKLDGYYESGEGLPEPGEIIEVKSLSGGHKRARVTSVTPGADPPIRASEVEHS